MSDDRVVICNWCDVPSDCTDAETTFVHGPYAICSRCIENGALQLVARRERNRRQLAEIREMGT